MCRTARKRPQERGSLPELTMHLPHYPQGQDLELYRESPPCMGHTELHGFPLFTWTHPEVSNGSRE